MSSCLEQRQRTSRAVSYSTCVSYRNLPAAHVTDANALAPSRGRAETTTTEPAFYFTGHLTTLP